MAQITVHRTGRPTHPARAARADRWGSWSDLFDDFVREQTALPALARGPRAGVRSRGVYPLVNLYETDDAFVLTAEIPGVSSNDIDVSLEGTTVTISGQRKVEVSAGDGTAVHRRERQSGHFRRAVELPSSFQIEGAEAKHHAGVLELRLPKTPESKPRQIPVQTS